MSRFERLWPPGSTLHRLFVAPDAPELALEVREESLGLVRARVEAGGVRLQAAAVLGLAPGTLRLSLTEPNVVDVPAFTAALGALLARCGAEGADRACLVLPDVVGRLRLFPDAELRGSSPAQTLEMARFRLKKALPYDVREARLAVDLPLAGHAAAHADGVVAVIARAVLESYEAACAASGLWAGRVELSSVALTRGLARRPGTLLLVNRDHGWASLLLLRQGWPLLARTLDREALPDDAALVREVRTTCTFAGERLQATPDVVLLRDATDEPALALALGAALALPVEVMAGPDGAPPGQGRGLAAARASFEGAA